MQLITLYELKLHDITLRNQNAQSRSERPILEKFITFWSKWCTKKPINDCARKRPLAEGWSLGPARWEPRLKRHSIDFRNSIKSIIFHKLNHASARNMYQNINFMNSNWSVIHHNVYKLSTTFTHIQSKTCPLHFRMFTEYPQNFLKGAI